MNRLPSLRRILLSAMVFLTSFSNVLESAQVAAPLPPALPRPGAGSTPTKVQYAVWLGDVTKIDSMEQTFRANFLMVLRWQDPRLCHDGPDIKKVPVDSIWNPRLLITNEVMQTTRALPEIAEVAPDGNVIYRQRYLGTFSQKLNLRTFPFDKASFHVTMVLLGHPPQDVQFVPDPLAVKLGMPDGVGRAETLTLQDWRVLSVTAHPEPYKASPGLELAGFIVNFTAARNAQYFVLKVILPLLLIVIMSWSVFWIDPADSSPQFSIAVTSMLTLIAYRFAIEANVPKLPYLTRLDAFILTSTVLVFFALIEVILVSRYARCGRLEAARTLDRVCRWVFPLVFICGMLVTLLE